MSILQSSVQGSLPCIAVAVPNWLLKQPLTLTIWATVDIWQLCSAVMMRNNLHTTVHWWKLPLNCGNVGRSVYNNNENYCENWMQWFPSHVTATGWLCVCSLFIGWPWHLINEATKLPSPSCSGCSYSSIKLDQLLCSYYIMFPVEGSHESNEDSPAHIENNNSI